MPKFVFALCFVYLLVNSNHGCHYSQNECVRVITVIDNNYKFSEEVYRRQMDSVICFATRYGYGYDEIDPANFEACRDHNVFFFAKHCAVQEYLKTRAKRESWVLVLDGDVIEAYPLVSLEKFLSSNSDLQLYERSWNPEIVSGNYLVKNTMFSQVFLKEWAKYEFKVPKGFSSADNGALHTHLSSIVPMVSTECFDGYQHLNQSVHNLSSYFSWISLCRSTGLLSGKTHSAQIRSFQGSINILEKYEGPVADYVYVSSDGTQPPLYHGVKNKELLNKTNGCWFINHPL